MGMRTADNRWLTAVAAALFVQALLAMGTQATDRTVLIILSGISLVTAVISAAFAIGPISRGDLATDLASAGCASDELDANRDFVGRMWLEQNRLLWSRIQTIYLLEIAVLSAWYGLPTRAIALVYIATVSGSVAMCVLQLLVVRDIEYLNHAGDILGRNLPRPPTVGWRSGRNLTLLFPVVLIAINLHLLLWRGVLLTDSGVGTGAKINESLHVAQGLNVDSETAHGNFVLNLAGQLLGPAATLLAVVLAVRSNQFTRLIAAPLLNLRLHDDVGEVITVNRRTVRYYHLIVTNGRDWAPATKVNVLVTKIDRKVDGVWKTVFNSSPLPLVWQRQSHFGGSPTIGFKRLCDFGSVGQGDDAFHIQVAAGLTEMNLTLRAHEELRVTVQAAGENGASNELTIEVSWDGMWEREDSEMKKHLRILAVSPV